MLIQKDIEGGGHLYAIVALRGVGTYAVLVVKNKTLNMSFSHTHSTSDPFPSFVNSK